MVSTRLSNRPKTSGGAAAASIKGRVVKRHKPAKKVVAVKVKKEGAPVVKKEEKREEKVDVGGPFPTFARPFEEECRNVTDVLIKLHGDPSRAWEKLEEDRHLIHGAELAVHTRRVSVLDSLVGTILSQNTTDKTSHKAFASLKRSFPTWESVRTGDPTKVAESIKVGGLSEIKTGRIQNILQSVWEESGMRECSLEHLRTMPDEAIKAYLSRFKGVGPKTISCVLMFCLERQEFPVDVHVWKIAISLGWVPSKATREQTYEHLNRKVPDDVKYALHVLLVEHGKEYNNDVKLLRPAVKKALASRSEEEGREPEEMTRVKKERV